MNPYESVLLCMMRSCLKELFQVNPVSSRNKVGSERGKQRTESVQSQRNKARDIVLSKPLAQNMNHS